MNKHKHPPTPTIEEQLDELFVMYGYPKLTQSELKLKAALTLLITKARDELLFDLDEIDNKPWRVFRQLAVIMPEYAEEYRRYEEFYANGGGRKVTALIEEFEKEQLKATTQEDSSA